MWPQLQAIEQASIPETEWRPQLERAVRRYGVLPRTVPLLFESCEDLRRIYTRACWTIERRTAALHMVPRALQDAMKIAPVPNPGAIDIWANEPAVVAEQTSCTCKCPTCRGTGEMSCPRCGGTGRINCDACRGRGTISREETMTTRIPGQPQAVSTITRTEQCLRCQATGQMQCDSCHNGRITCSQCSGSTVVEAWVGVSVERMGQVRFAADFDVESMHSGVALVEDFDTPLEQLPAVLIADTGLQLPDAFPSCPKPLQSLLDGRTDRLRGVRVQQLRAPGIKLHAVTRFRHEEIELVGRPPQLVSGPINLLRQRASLSVGLGVVTLALGLLAVGYYLQRSTWFGVYGKAEVLAALVVLDSILVVAFVLGATLRRSPLRWAAPLIGLLLTSYAFAEVWRTAAPSVTEARAAIARGDLERAEKELSALATLGGEDELAEVEYELEWTRGQTADRERMARLAAATDLRTAAEILREPWYEPALRDKQIEPHIERARAVMADAWTNARPSSLDEVIAALQGIDKTVTARAKTLAELLAIRAMITNADLEAAHARLEAITVTHSVAEEHASVELELIEAIATAARNHYAIGLDDKRNNEDRAASLARFEALVALHESITHEIPSDVDRAHAAEIAKLLGKLLDKAKRAREREEVRKRKTAKGPGNMLTCNDGTYSKTCTCDGDWTGCCSKHGGVAGCG